MTTDITPLLAEDITAVLDFLSRVIAATDDGGSSYLHDKTRQLAGATQRLHEHLSTKPAPGTQREWDRDKRFSPTKLTALITRDARYYAAGRALYPVGGDATAAARQHALESAANAIRFDPATEFTPAQSDVIATWLLQRAQREVSG